MMPGLGGLEIARQARRLAPQTRVVILSMHANEAYVAEALRAGAQGYILKESASQDLVAGLRAVLAGHRYLSAQISLEALAEYDQMAEADAPNPRQALTARERQVLSLLAEGLTNGQIAARLRVGQRTVETHRANLMRKLNLHTTAELTRYAMQQGLVPLK
jgi:two-component system, NarL family, response regulator NreC